MNKSLQKLEFEKSIYSWIKHLRGQEAAQKRPLRSDGPHPGGGHWGRPISFSLTSPYGEGSPSLSFQDVITRSKECQALSGCLPDWGYRVAVSAVAVQPHKCPVWPLVEHEATRRDSIAIGDGAQGPLHRRVVVAATACVGRFIVHIFFNFRGHFTWLVFWPQFASWLDRWYHNRRKFSYKRNEISIFVQCQDTGAEDGSHSNDRLESGNWLEATEGVVGKRFEGLVVSRSIEFLETNNNCFHIFCFSFYRHFFLTVKLSYIISKNCQALAHRQKIPSIRPSENIVRKLTVTAVRKRCQKKIFVFFLTFLLCILMDTIITTNAVKKHRARSRRYYQRHKVKIRQKNLQRYHDNKKKLDSFNQLLLSRQK